MSFEDGIGDLAPAGKICLGLYGRPGAGKTVLIGSSSQRVLILRPPTDGTSSIIAVHGPKPNIKERVVKNWVDMDDALSWARDGDAAESFDWVWLDSVSLYQDHGLDDIWATVVAQKPHRRQHGLDKGEYGVNMERLGQWVRGMVATPGFHFGFTGHVGEVDDEETGEVVAMPYVQGKNMPQKLCGSMNVVAYLTTRTRKERTERVLRTSTHEHYYAKDEFDALGTLINPTLDEITEAITGKPVVAAPTTRRRRTTAKRRSTRSK